MNRDRAVYQCGRWLGPNPGGVDCDEYPFASTYQGMLSNENDYSIADVNSAQNELEGSWRGAWYIMDRILEGDSFGVGVFDGPPEG